MAKNVGENWQDLDITEPMAWNKVPFLLDALAKHLGVKFQRSSGYGVEEYRVVPVEPK